MFNFESNIRDVSEDERVEDLSDDEYFSGVDSDENEDDNFDYDSDDTDTHYSESDDEEFYINDNKDDNDVNISFGDTISKALILWAIAFGISHTALSALLIILKRFGHNELPKLARTLLRTPRKAVKPRPCPPGEFFYRGIQYNMYQYNYEFLKECDTVDVDFFIDGLSLYDSSKMKMWPIMGSFVNQPTIRPFVVGCYSGYGDPLDVDDFMKEFAKELEDLQRNGVQVTKNRLHKKFRFRCFVADAPARSFASGTMGHSSYFGCPRCDQVCCHEGHKMYYQYFVGNLRTDESFRQRTDPQHHKPQFQNRPSSLEGVMGMVTQFVIEAMHAVDLGVTKRISKVIFTGKSLCKSVTKTAFQTLQAHFKSFRKHVPSDFARKPRSLNDINKFKAAEFRQMLLYTLPVLLKNVVGPELYKHFLKLHVAIRLLSDPSKYKENINAARELIKQFVDEYDDIFGKENFTFYTHCLLHLPDYVEMYGPLYSLSAYKYENHMRVIKRLLRRKHGHLQQFFNRVEEMRFADELASNDRSRNECNLNDFHLKPNSLRDGCCMVAPGYPLLITGSLTRNGLEMVRGYRYMQCNDFYDDPLPSMENMGIILASNLSEIEEEFPVTSIMHKFFRTTMEHLVLNKWIIPKSAASTNNNNNISKKTLPQQKFPQVRQSTNHIPILIQSNVRIAQANDKSLKKLDHKFAVPAPVSRKLNSKKTSPTVLTAMSIPNGSSSTKLYSSRGYPIASQARSQLNKGIAKAMTPGKNEQTSIRSLPKIQCTDGKQLANNRFTPLKVVTKNGIVALPTNWKLIKSSPNVQLPALQFNETSPMTQTQKNIGKTISSIPNPTGNSISSDKGIANSTSNFGGLSASINKNIELTSQPATPVHPIISKISDLTAPQVKSIPYTSAISREKNEQLVSLPNIVYTNGNKTSISVAKNKLLPLPSNWKLVRGLPIVQSNVQLSALQQKNIPLTQKGKDGIKIISSIAITTGHEEQKEIPSEKIRNTAENSSHSAKLRLKMAPLKGRPWSWYIGTSNSFENTNSNCGGPFTSINKTQKLISHEKGTLPIHLFTSTIKDNAQIANSNGSVNKSFPQPNSEPRTASKNHILSGSASVVGPSGSKREWLSNRADSFIIESDNSTGDEETDAKKKKTSPGESSENNYFHVILEEFRKLKKRDVRNSSNIKAMARRIMEEDETVMSFKFPLRTEAEYENFERCLQKPRFTTKLVTKLENKVANSSEIVSDLVETIFHPNLLRLFTVCGLQGNKNFSKLKINEIFLKISKMKPKEYYYDLTKVINKMHKRYKRHPDENN